MVDGLLTTQEMADRMGVCIRTIKYWKAKRMIEYVQIGRAVRFPAGQIAVKTPEKQQ